MCELPPLVAGTAVPESCCGERRVLRRLAEPDGSQGASVDNEVAVGQQQERKSFGRRDEPEPGPTACGEIVTWERQKSLPERSRSVAGTNRNRGRRPAAVSSRRGRRRRKRVLRASAGVRASAEHGVTAGSLEETVRPSSASVVR